MLDKCAWHDVDLGPLPEGHPFHGKKVRMPYPASRDLPDGEEDRHHANDGSIPKSETVR